MAVISINGLSGSGKTLQATAIAIKHFEKENNIIKRLVRRIKKEDIYINNVYSNYPILLKKKPLIYSKKLSTFQLDNSYRFLPNSLLINDEVQICYDSDEFKAFPKLIANFNQAQRHFYIKDIIYISQHPSRIIKKLRNVISEFRKIRRTFILPFLKIGFIYYTIYYEFEDYGKWHKPNKEAKTYDVKNKIQFINFRKIYKRYNDKYMYPINRDKPLYSNDTYTSLDMSKEDIQSHFRFFGGN